MFKLKKMSLILKCITCLIILNHSLSFSQELERPFILVKSQDRALVLNKIKNKKWAADIYNNLLNDVNKEQKLFVKDTKSYLKKLPFNWSEQKSGEFPPFYKTDHVLNGKHKNLDNATKVEWEPAQRLIDQLQIALNCSMAYYVSQDDKYAYMASSILYAFVKSVQKAELSDWHGRGGWLFPYDGFREVRVIGYKLPLIYDFIAPYIRKGGLPYDMVKNINVVFPVQEAQSVFKTYADITVHYGHTGSNHSVLEAPSLVYNALALDDEALRNTYLSYFLNKSTKNQDALNVMAANYKTKGSIWPETSQYLNHSTAIIAKLMLVINKFKPELKLGEKYPNVLYALPRLDYFVYPNNQIIRWGDGKRKGHAPYDAFDDAYALAEMDNLTDVKETLGPLINSALNANKYKREGMEAVFWYNDITEPAKPIELGRTDRVYHAGIVLQRNLSDTKKPEDGLMCFVGGAGMVHGHAEGMNIELYGEGQVLGVDNGRGRYAKDIHENYSRIFAAHNTVIVNGNSQGEAGWSNLGINTVKLVSMEPQVNTPAVSPYHSFSQTSFDDTGGNKAEAKQQRTLGLIRTSSTTGYYVDVFRSKSKLPNEYHDYLYHNIADNLSVDNKDMGFKINPLRYLDNANLKWNNRSFRNPGWHFFKDVQTSKTYKKDVLATFNTTRLKQGSVFMQLHIPGFENRDYSVVNAPHTFEAPKPYHKLATPTLVIRNKGAAWDNPFVVVFEPYNSKEKPTIKSVTKLTENSIYKGLKIESALSSRNKIIQYVITQSQGDVFTNKTLGLYFKGTYAVVTINKKDKSLKSIYVGEGEELRFKDQVIKTDSNKSFFKNYN